MASTQVKKVNDGSDSGGRWFTFVIIGIFVLGAAAVAFVASNRNSAANDSDIVRGTDVEVNADVEITGDPLIPMPGSGVLADPATDAAVGVIAPTLVGTDFSGNTVSIEPDGRPKAIYFLAHWCPACQEEVPSVVDLLESGALPENVDVYGISTSVDQTRGNFPPNNWLAREGWTPEIMRDTAGSEALIAYGAGPFPFVVYLDGDNRVLARSSGVLGESQITTIWETLAVS